MNFFSNWIERCKEKIVIGFATRIKKQINLTGTTAELVCYEDVIEDFNIRFDGYVSSEFLFSACQDLQTCLYTRNAKLVKSKLC